jgi:hypothetical protein
VNGVVSAPVRRTRGMGAPLSGMSAVAAAKADRNFVA